MPPPPASGVVGVGGGESPSPGTIASCPRYLPRPPLTFQGFLWTGFPYSPQARLPCSHHTPALSAGQQPLCASLLVTFMTKGVCSLLSQSLFLCPPPQLGHPVFAFAEAATKFP